MHELCQPLHEAAVTAVDFVMWSYHVRNECVVPSAHLWKDEGPGGGEPTWRPHTHETPSPTAVTHFQQ